MEQVFLMVIFLIWRLILQNGGVKTILTLIVVIQQLGQIWSNFYCWNRYGIYDFICYIKTYNKFGTVTQNFSVKNLLVQRHDGNTEISIMPPSGFLSLKLPTDIDATETDD